MADKTAEIAYKKAIQIDSNAASSWFNLGLLYTLFFKISIIIITLNIKN